MSDEQNKVEECKCKNCEICKLVGKFFFLTGAIFLGTLFALLLAHALNKPQFPPFHRGMYGIRPGIEKQIPCKCHKGLKKDFKGRHHKFDKQRPHEFNDFRPPKKFEGKNLDKKLNRAYVNPEKMDI